MRVGGVYLSASCIREVPFCAAMTSLQCFFHHTLRSGVLAGGHPDQRRRPFIAALDFALEYLHKITGTVFDV